MDIWTDIWMDMNMGYHNAHKKRDPNEYVQERREDREIGRRIIYKKTPLC